MARVSSAAQSFRLQLREQDHVADAFLAEEHRAVNADADAAGGRPAGFERDEKTRLRENQNRFRQRFKRKNVRLVTLNQRKQIAARAVAESEPDEFRRRTVEQGALIKIPVL